MPGTTTPNLTAASALDGTELFYGVQGGANRKITANQIKDFASIPGLASRTAFLDAAGDDGTAVVGNSALPFVTAQAAVDALLALGTPMSAANPAALFVGVGSFGNVTVAVDLKGLNIAGLGKAASRIGNITAEEKDIEITSDLSVKLGDISSQSASSGGSAGDITLFGCIAVNLMAAGLGGVAGTNGGPGEGGGTGGSGGNGGTITIQCCQISGYCNTGGANGGNGGDAGDDGMGTPANGGDGGNGGNGGNLNALSSSIVGATSSNTKGTGGAGGNGVNGGTNGGPGGDGSDGAGEINGSYVTNSALIGISNTPSDYGF